MLEVKNGIGMLSVGLQLESNMLDRRRNVLSRNLFATDLCKRQIRYLVSLVHGEKYFVTITYSDEF